MKSVSSSGKAQARSHANPSKHSTTPTSDNSKRQRPREKTRAQRRRDLQARRQSQHGESPQARLNWQRPPAPALAPNDPRDHERHEEAVPHVFVGPPLMNHSAQRGSVAERPAQEQPALAITRRMEILIPQYIWP